MESAIDSAGGSSVEAIPENLFDFAYCRRPDDYLGELAALAAPEDWGANGSVLNNYLHHLFAKLAGDYNAAASGAERERLMLVRDDAACFNTGLYTERYEDIYCLFEPNRNAGAQPWFLAGFCKASSPRLPEADVLPEPPRFFDDPVELIYDFRLKIRLNKDHILGDERNLERIPEALRAPGQRMLLHRAFEGAVAEAERRAASNYMLAVPQYFNGRIQLLLPLCLTGDQPELALAIQRENGYYSARTCLTLDMAYNNARLIARPETTWIKPRS